MTTCSLACAARKHLNSLPYCSQQNASQLCVRLRSVGPDRPVCRSRVPDATVVSRSNPEFTSASSPTRRPRLDLIDLNRIMTKSDHQQPEHRPFRHQGSEAPVRWRRRVHDRQFVSGSPAYLVADKVIPDHQAQRRRSSTGVPGWRFLHRPSRHRRRAAGPWYQVRILLFPLDCQNSARRARCNLASFSL
jgi:hypothetical protein